MRLDSLQIHLPSQMLTVHFAHVSHKEGILLSCIASICVYALNTLPQPRLSQVFTIFFAIFGIDIKVK